jgi:hypothetical protein
VIFYKKTTNETPNLTMKTKTSALLLIATFVLTSATIIKDYFPCGRAMAKKNLEKVKIL